MTDNTLKLNIKHDDNQVDIILSEHMIVTVKNDSNVNDLYQSIRDNIINVEIIKDKNIDTFYKNDTYNIIEKQGNMDWVEDYRMQLKEIIKSVKDVFTGNESMSRQSSTISNNSNASNISNITDTSIGSTASITSIISDESYDDHTYDQLFVNTLQACSYIMIILTRVYVCTLVSIELCNKEDIGSSNRHDLEGKIANLKQMLLNTTALLANFDQINVIKDETKKNTQTGGSKSLYALDYEVTNDHTNLTFKMTSKSSNMNPIPSIIIPLNNETISELGTNGIQIHMSIPILIDNNNRFLITLTNYNLDSFTSTNINLVKQSLKSLINTIKKNETFEPFYNDYLNNIGNEDNVIAFDNLRFIRHQIYVAATKLYVLVTVKEYSLQKSCKKMEDISAEYKNLKDLLLKSNNILLNIDSMQEKPVWPNL